MPYFSQAVLRGDWRRAERSIVGRVRDHHGIGARDLQLLQDDRKHIRSRSGLIGVLGRGRDVNQFRDARDVKIFVEFISFGRRSNGDPKSGVADEVQQVGYRRERAAAAADTWA